MRAITRRTFARLSRWRRGRRRLKSPLRQYTVRRAGFSRHLRLAETGLTEAGYSWDPGGRLPAAYSSF